MIMWLSITQIVIAIVAALVCLGLWIGRQVPNDWSVGAILLLELALIVQLFVAIFAPMAGNAPSGNLLEFWSYLVSALLIPAAAIVWAFTERSKWSNLVMAAAAIAIAVMVWRMQVIWTTVPL